MVGFYGAPHPTGIYRSIVGVHPGLPFSMLVAPHLHLNLMGRVGPTKAARKITLEGLSLLCDE